MPNALGHTKIMILSFGSVRSIWANKISRNINVIYLHLYDYKWKLATETTLSIPIQKIMFFHHLSYRNLIVAFAVTIHSFYFVRPYLDISAWEFFSPSTVKGDAPVSNSYIRTPRLHQSTAYKTTVVSLDRILTDV